VREERPKPAPTQDGKTGIRTATDDDEHQSKSRPHR